MAERNLTNRSSRFGSPPNSATSRNGNGRGMLIAKEAPLRRPNTYGANGDNNMMSVKSTMAPPTRYVLPCFRFRNKKTALMSILATAIFASICSAFLAYQSLSSMSSASSPSAGHFLLPSPKEWGAGRERRKQARQQRRRRAFTPTTNKEVVVDDSELKYSEYETILLNYLFTLRAEGVKSSILPFKNVDPLGQDMNHYSNLGCSVFNQLYNNNNNQKKSKAKEQMQQLWSSHLSSILAASRHADDTAYLHKNWTTTILKSLSPYSIIDHLPDDNSAKNAMDTKDIERIIGIIVRRFLGLLQNKGQSSGNLPPPLRVAVFGGPTVEGMGCHRARVGIPQGSIMANPTFCSFPYRLEQFLNAMLLPPMVLQQLRKTLGGGGTGVISEGFRLVEVINLGEEGTSSDYSTAIVRNRIYPPFVLEENNGATTGYGGGPPDLVIDAYGIDDHGKESSELNSLYDAMRQPYSKVQKGCSKENQKPPPVIIRAVLEDDTSTTGLSSIMTAVLGDAVDDVEEGEMSLIDAQNPDSKETEPGGAFGMAGHVATSWTIAFNLAFAAISHCGSAESHSQLAVHQRIRNNVNMISPDGCDNGIDPPCIFSFLAGQKGTATRPSAIASNLMPFVVENTGWQPGSDMSTGFARKMGLVGTGTGATLTLLFRNVTRPVRRFDVITLRSTSEEWREGAVQFVLVTGGDFSHGSEAAEKSAEVAREMNFEISAALTVDNMPSGQDRHISYHFGLDLTEEDITGQLGTDVLLKLILTKGSRFKILGLMLCE